MDMLLLEELVFTLQAALWNQCSVAPSREEALRHALAQAGLELIDYDSYITLPCNTRERLGVRIMAFSKAFRERAERDHARP